jgi:hypothetical protein
MKAYLITTSAIFFGMITIAHVLRMIYEGPGVASDPWFVALTGLSVALCAWACLLLARLQSPRRQ